MERKTIGSLIAALRRAKGWTQRQLAEQLQVSDKTVSRWERDECAPDLALIPVIAALFEVTADELLRGERRPQEPSADNAAARARQVERLLRATETQFGIRSLMALGLGIAGLLAAAACNYGFSRAYVGFIAACVFYLAALIAESIFIIRAFSAISGDFDSARSKRRLFIMACSMLTAVTVLFAAALPLCYLPFDAYMGLTAEAWFWHALPCGLIAAAACGGAAVLTGRALHWFKGDRSAAVLCIALAALLLGQLCWNGLVKPGYLAKARIFEIPAQMQEFVDYMKTPAQPGGEGTGFAVVADDPSEESDFYTVHYYNEQEELIPLHYTWRNQKVVQLSCDYKGKGVRRIRTYTDAAMIRAIRLHKNVSRGWLFLYPLAAALVLILRKKRRAH